MTLLTDQGAEEEEGHECSAKRRIATDVAIANRWHGNDDEIDALPVSQLLRVLEVLKWISC